MPSACQTWLRNNAFGENSNNHGNDISRNKNKPSTDQPIPSPRISIETHVMCYYTKNDKIAWQWFYYTIILDMKEVIIFISKALFILSSQPPNIAETNQNVEVEQ